MSRPQKFTFIDVTEGKETNKRRVKSHVANDTNRRKRQAAVTLYQNAVLQLETRTTTTTTTSSNSSPSTSPSTIQSTPEDLPSNKQPSNTGVKLKVTLDDALSTRLKQSYSNWLASSSSSLSSSPSTTPETPITDDPWSTFRDSLIRPRSFPLSNQVALVKRHPAMKVEHSPFDCTTTLSTVWSPVPPIINLCAPDDLRQTEQALTQIKIFLQGKYQSTWSHNLTLNPHRYEHDYEVGIWRESLSLGFDLFRRGMNTEGFAIIDASLEVARDLLKRQHPNVIFALLELVMDVRNIHDRRLAQVVKNYLANLASAILGTSHPLTTLLRYSTPTGPGRDQCTATLFQQILDIYGGIFGPFHFQTLALHFAMIEHDVNSRRIECARARHSMVLQHWNGEFPPKAMPLYLLAVEEEKFTPSEAELDASPKVTGAVRSAVSCLEDLTAYMINAGSHSGNQQGTTSFTPSTSSARKLRMLGEYFTARSYHAMALYTYTHVNTVFSSFSPRDQKDGMIESQFPAFVVKVILRTLCDHQQV